MTQAEFLKGWSVLTAALGFDIPKASRELYATVLADLPDGAFVSGVRSLVVSPEFSELVRFKRLPTLYELREQCQAQTNGPKGEPYVGGVPLRQLLCGVQREGDGPPPSREEAAEIVDRVAAGAAGRRLKLLPGPGNTGHAALARRRALVRVMPPGLNESDWEARRRPLLEQADEGEAS